MYYEWLKQTFGTLFYSIFVEITLTIGL